MSKRTRADVDLIIEKNENEQTEINDKCMQQKLTNATKMQQQNRQQRREQACKQNKNDESMQKHISQHSLYQEKQYKNKRSKVNVDYQDAAVQEQKQSKNAKTHVDERVAQSHRRFSAYIASWRQEVYSETQHGTPIIRKPSSLPSLSPLPLLLTSQHLALFGTKTKTVGNNWQTKREAAISCSSNKFVDNQKQNKEQQNISNLVHDFFHSSSSTKYQQGHNKNNYLGINHKDKEYTNSAPCTGVIYDTAMYSHRSSNPQEYQRPLRLQRTIEHLTAIKLLQCCKLLPSRLASSRELRRAHSRNLIDYIDRIDFVLAIRASPTVSTPTPVVDQSQPKQSSTPHINNNRHSNNNINDKNYYNGINEQHTNPIQSLEIGQDLYACSHTSHVARLAAGCAVEAALAVWRNEVANAFALIRPPGHHAMRDAAKGFCFYNNVAVAVRAVQAFAAEQGKQYSENVINDNSNDYHNKDMQGSRVNTNVMISNTSNKWQQSQQQQHKLCKIQSQSHSLHSAPVKIMIIDWDVHHCDGTEDIFYNDDSVLVVSIHQHGNKRGHVLCKVPTEMKQTNTHTFTTITTSTTNNNNTNTQSGSGDNNKTDYLSVNEVAQLMNTTLANKNMSNANLTAASGNEVQKEEANDIFTTSRQSTRRRATVDYNKLAQQLDGLNDANDANVVNHKNNKRQDADVAAAALFGVDLRHHHYHHHYDQQKKQQNNKSKNKQRDQKDYINDSSSNSDSTSSSSSSSWSSTYSDHVHTKDANNNHNAVHYEGDSAGASFDSFTASISSLNYNSDSKDKSYCVDATLSLLRAKNNVQDVQNEACKKLNGSNDIQQGSRDHISNNNVSRYDKSKDVITQKVGNNNNHDDNKQIGKVGQLNKHQQQQQHEKQNQKMQQQLQQQEQLFYPASGHLYRIGGDVCHRARGRNINIPWPTHGMGDVQYMRLFYELILPAAKQFAPAMVFVSCGFDSASNDLLGSMRLTPSGYYLMTKLLLEHFPRMIVVLQGGYHAQNVALCSEAVLRALLQASNCTNTRLPPSRML